MREKSYKIPTHIVDLYQTTFRLGATHIKLQFQFFGIAFVDTDFELKYITHSFIPEI